MTVPSHVGVIGGGRMGAGIAHAFLLAGASVTILERDEAARHAPLMGGPAGAGYWAWAAAQADPPPAAPHCAAPPPPGQSQAHR
jgi:glycine/D-amino acid oxidase-like deaminating enzyme